VSDIRTIATHPPAHRAGGWSGRIVGDSLTLAARTTRLSMRRPDALLTAVLMPVMLMVLFGNLFGGAIHTGVNYVSYLVPGVVLTCVLLGSSTTAVSVNDDMTHGIIDRFRSLDVGGPAFLAGHVAASVARSAASTVLVFAVAFPMGFHAEAGPMEWLAMAGVVLLLILAVCWLSAVGGLIVSSPDAASSLTFFMMLVAFISSAFVPLQTMPTWLRVIAEHQPATPIIDTIRALLQHEPVGSNAWLALAWCGGIVLACLVLSSVLFQRRTA
jgi:ABC-2 type transport system permease protein